MSLVGGLSIHRVLRVECALTERRDYDTCDDHDVYKLSVVSRDYHGHETTLELVLFADANADIGLDSLVLDGVLADPMAGEDMLPADEPQAAE